MEIENINKIDENIRKKLRVEIKIITFLYEYNAY